MKCTNPKPCCCNEKSILLRHHVQGMEGKDRTIENHASYITALEKCLSGFIGTEDVEKLRDHWLIEIV
jgi:hypothetical protein